MEVDFHVHHPDDIMDTVFPRIVQQTWEMGDSYLKVIHGHGRNRGKLPGFVNTNTGFFGLRVRAAIRRRTDLRMWIKHSTLDCGEKGATEIKMKIEPRADASRAR